MCYIKNCLCYITFSHIKDETAIQRKELESRIAELEENLSSALANHGNFLNITLQRLSDENGWQLLIC